MMKQKVLTEFNCNSIFIFNKLKERRNTQRMLIARVDNRMNPDMSVNDNQGLGSVYAIRSVYTENS